MSTRWPGFGRWRFAIWMAAGAAAVAPAWAVNDYSVAEQALFMNEQLAQIKPPQTLRYAYTRRGTLEVPFDDHVDVVFAAQPDGTCCSASTRFLDSTRGAPQPSIDGLHGNPVILYFLERDIQEMQRLTKGQPNYFRTRIRMAIYQGATMERAERPYQGRLVAVQQFTVAPYNDDPLRARFARFADKRYVFALSSEVPGGVYSIETQMADPSNRDAPPLVTERLLLDGVEAR